MLVRRAAGGDRVTMRIPQLNATNYRVGWSSSNRRTPRLIGTVFLNPQESPRMSLFPPGLRRFLNGRCSRNNAAESGQSCRRNVVLFLNRSGQVPAIVVGFRRNLIDGKALRHALSSRPMAERFSRAALVSVRCPWLARKLQNSFVWPPQFDYGCGSQDAGAKPASDS